MYFCMYDLTLLFISVFHRCDSFGHDPWNPRTRQWSAVCSSEYNQFEVGLSVTLWASGHNNGQYFLSHLFNHRFISSGISYWNTHILSFFHSFEVGSCIAVQVCMIQIPILVLFNIFYVSGFGYAFFDADILQIFSDSCINVFTLQSFCDRMLALYSSSVTCTCGPASLVSSLWIIFLWMESLIIFKVKAKYDLNQGLVTLPKITSSSTDNSWQNAKLQTHAQKLQHYSNIWDQ